MSFVNTLKTYWSREPVLGFSILIGTVGCILPVLVGIPSADEKRKTIDSIRLGK